MDSKTNNSEKATRYENFCQWCKSDLMHLRLITLFMFSMIIFSSKLFGQAANLDQIRNGTLGVYSPTPLADWVNGNAGPSNAHFAEGYSIPYRAYVDALTFVGTAATPHHLIIEWDTKDQNGHAIDYITHYQNLNNPTGSHNATFGHAAEIIVPTLGTSFSGNPLLYQIPAPSSAGAEVAGMPGTSFTNLATVAYTNNPDITKMAIWGGTITNMVYVHEDNQDATTASTKTSLDISFIATNGSTALFAWGGHIATEYDWGAGRGATGVNGSPYHTRIVTIDGKPGGQDRSLKATAVIIPPPVCGISPAQFACPETPSLSFSATGSSTGSNVSYVWTLTNGSTSAGARIRTSGTGNTGFTIIVEPIGTAFIAGGTFNLSLTVNKTGATPTTCSISPAGTIVKVIATASASPTQIDLTSAAHSTTLTGDIGSASTFTTNTDYTYAWTIVTAGTNGSFGTTASSRIATYTAAINDPTSITFKVTATLNKTGNPACTDDETVTVTLVGPGVCDVSPQTAVCQGTETTHNGSPNPKSTNATYAWSLQGYGGSGTTTATLVGGNSGTTQQKVTANQSYRIVLTQTYLNTALNTSCFEDVTVVPTPTVSAIYNPPGCTETTFSIDVPNSVSTSNYRVTQGGEVTPSYDQTKAGNGATLNFSGLAAGGGFLVRVTTGTASCTATTNCGSSTNSCASAAKISGNTIVSESAVAKTTETYNIELESATKVKAVPNPYTDRVSFNLVSGVTGYGTLELFNTLGQKVAVVYQGYVQAGKAFNREYFISRDQKGLLIYVFKVGEQKVTGKLIGLK